MDALLSDIRFAIRSLGKSKTFTVVALLSLALGIGVNVTVFSMVSALAFKPLPYVEPDRLVDVSEWSATKLCSGCGVGASYDGFLDWRSRARSFTAMGAYSERPPRRHVGDLAAGSAGCPHRPRSTRFGRSRRNTDTRSILVGRSRTAR